MDTLGYTPIDINAGLNIEPPPSPNAPAIIPAKIEIKINLIIELPVKSISPSHIGILNSFFSFYSRLTIKTARIVIKPQPTTYID